MGGYSSKNYTEQGGERTVIGGTLEFEEDAQVKDLPGFADLVSRVSTLEGKVSALEETVSGLVDGNEVGF